MYDNSKYVEKLRSLFMEKKPVIIIGGVAGSGKTITTNELVYRLKIDHRIGTGWIREIAASKTTREKEPDLFVHSFRPYIKDMHPFEHFKNASYAILPSVEACVDRARREGQSLVIEGPMLIPGILKEDKYDAFFLLTRPDSDSAYFDMLTKGTHTKRKIYESDLKNNREIEDKLVSVCHKNGVKVIPFMDQQERIENILTLLGERFF